MQGTNKVILLGTLGRDPEARTSQTGMQVATLSVATSEKWRDKTTGQMQQKTEWHRVTLFGKLAEIAQSYLAKGSKLYLEGKLQTRKYTDRQGAEKSLTEIIGNEIKLIDPKQRYQSQETPSKPNTATAVDDNFNDDDIPF